MDEQKQLFENNKIVKECPKCKKSILCWLVCGKLYGFCERCVHGWYF